METPLVFEYKEFPINRSGDKGKIGSKKPLLKLASKEFPNRKVDCLVDSGADKSISFKTVGEVWFGITFSKYDKIENRIYGLHTCPDTSCAKHPHKAPAYQKPITFLVGDKDVALNVIWLDRGFNPNEDLPFILGRDFFDYFDILFKQRKEEFLLFPH